jgi:predicted secreted protein
MSQKILLDINSNGKKIELKVGDEIQIELKTVGSAGYSWYINKLDQDFFDLTGEERKGVAPEKGDVVGTPVVMVWKLRARKPGNSMIRMSYYRLWEGKDKAVNQFEILVDITP